MSGVSAPVLAVSIAVFRDDGRALIAQRGQAPMEGLWSLPGGRVEAGEALAEAALRELREEVSIEAEVVGFNGHVEAIRRDEAGAVVAHYVICSFVGRWIGGEPTPGPEARAVRWIDPLRLGDLPVTQGLADVLARAAALFAAARRP